MNKKCSGCSQVLPLSNFPLRNYRCSVGDKTTHSARCKECSRKASLASYHRNKIKSNKHITPPNTKTCTKCDILKPLSDFNTYKNSLHNAIYRQSLCKDCVRDQNYKNFRKRNFERVTKGTKICGKCNQTLSVSDFHRDKSMKDGLTPWCKICNNNQRRFSNTGATPAKFQELLQIQEGKCVICNTQTQLVVDHDHRTDKNKIRGLLCHECNKALGHIKDDIGIARKMIDYLIKHSSEVQDLPYIKAKEKKLDIISN